MEQNFKPDLENCYAKLPYRCLVCSVLYIALTTLPDIAFPISLLARYLDKPTDQLFGAAKRVLRYLNCTKEKGLFFVAGGGDSIMGMSDSDWASDIITRKSVSGFVCFHGRNLVAYHSRKQNSVSLSSMEGEYYAAAVAAQEMVNLKGIAQEMTGRATDSTLKMGNQSAIAVVRTSENSKRSEHIDIRYHFIKDLVQKKELKLKYIISTDENIADICTKPLGREKFVRFRDLIVKSD